MKKNKERGRKIVNNRRKERERERERGGRKVER